MSWLDDLFGGAQSAAQSVVSSISDIPDEWSAKVAELKARAQEFMALFSDLEARSAQAAAAGLSSEYASLMARGASIKAQVQRVTSAVDSIYSSVSSLFGLSGMAGSLGNLGFIPLIPIAVIVGAIALMVSWITDAYTLRNKLAAAQAAGASAAQITQIAAGKSGSILPDFMGSNSLLGSAGMFLMVGAGVLLFVPLLKKAFDR